MKRRGVHWLGTRERECTFSQLPPCVIEKEEEGRPAVVFKLRRNELESLRVGCDKLSDLLLRQVRATSWMLLHRKARQCGHPRNGA